MAKSLENITVLDFTRAYAGPFCTMLLKELGAEIIKIEIPGGGDAVRGNPPQTEGGEGYIFVILNRGKKSITLNLRSEKGRQITMDLTKRVDVVVENFSPGVMDRLGLGYGELSKINPTLIYASLSGFGHTGPYSSQAAYDIVAQAMGGLMGVTGFPGNPPTKVGTAIADFLGGFYTAVSVLAALQHRWRTGGGQAIDISMQDCVWALTAIEYCPGYFLTGENPEPLGNGVVASAPFNAYLAKDGYVVINVATVGQWEELLRIMGREDLIGNQSYTTSVGRVTHRNEVDAIVSEWTRPRTVEEVVNVLRNARLPCSPIPTFDRVANDPQLTNREMIVDVEQPISGKLKVPGSVFKMSGTPGDARLPAPFLGEHNYDIYSRLLGYNEQEITELADEGII